MIGRGDAKTVLWSRSWLACFSVCFIQMTAIAVFAACGSAEKPMQTEGSTDSASASAQASQPASLPPEIAVYAGTGSPKFKGDGGPAKEAGFFSPTGVAVDDSGNVYISTGNRIRKVDAVTSVITTFAGTGGNRYEGDGGPATEGSMAEPEKLRFDKDGNLFVVEKGSNRIRRIDAVTGIITTVAGGGVGNPMKKIFGDGGPATDAFVRFPEDVAFDGEGNLYIATDNRIRKVDAVTGTINTVVGTGDRGVEGDGGPATSAKVAEAVGLSLDEQGNIYIVDSENHRIRKVDSATGIITTLAGVGTHYERTNYANLGLPATYDRSSAPATGFGYAGDGGPASKALLQTPTAITLDQSGNVIFVDGGVRIRMIDAATSVITTIAAAESETKVSTGKVQVVTTIFGDIVAIAINDEGDLFLADKKRNVVHRISSPEAP